MNNIAKSFLKWPGGKFRALQFLKPHLTPAKRMVEPFVGSGVVSLNTDYSNYLLCDANKDLICLYQIIQNNHLSYIKESKKMFHQINNNADSYYEIRNAFNASTDVFLRSIYFLYLNRFGYNGLCRYNNSGIFNVPFGKYRQPYFPEKEIIFFAEKTKSAVFECADFRQTLKKITSNDVVYCDPPYIPTSKTANFASYYINKFNYECHASLADLCGSIARNKKVRVVVSNSDTSVARDLYQDSKIYFMQVQRNISSKANTRVKASEILAVF